jgi:hypothetical protein
MKKSESKAGISGKNSQKNTQMPSRDKELQEQLCEDYMKTVPKLFAKLKNEDNKTIKREKALTKMFKALSNACNANPSKFFSI